MSTLEEPRGPGADSREHGLPNDLCPSTWFSAKLFQKEGGMDQPLDSVTFLAVSVLKSNMKKRNLK